MKLSEIIQNQNSRVDTLENNELDDNMTVAKIKKQYNDISITTKIKVATATYFKCGELVCSPTQKNTKSYTEVIF